jgi:hypothetical protein
MGSPSRHLVPVPESDLDRLAREARSHHQQAEAGWQSAVEHAYHCGEVLLEARPLCPYGSWHPWLREVGIPVRTATHYMRFAEIGNLADLPTITGALQTLTKPKPKEDAWQRWLRLVGEIPSPNRSPRRRRNRMLADLRKYEPFPQDPKLLRQEIASCQAPLTRLYSMLDPAGRLDGVGRLRAAADRLEEQLHGLAGESAQGTGQRAGGLGAPPA